MNTPKLSICIATRNRAAFIGQTLESIISQATDDVEIVIVDGASTDHTEQVVEQYQRKFGGLRYFRQDINHGVDRDYSRTVELALGEYCWLMTDDDVLKPQAIPTVLAHLKQGYDLIIANVECRTIDMARVLEDRLLQFRADRVYPPAASQSLFADVIQHLSFIATVIVKRDLWNARDKAPYFGSLFVHVGVLFQKPFTNDVLVIAEPLIVNRRGNVSWGSRSFEIWMFLWPSLVWSFPDFSDSVKGQVVPREPWLNLMTLLKFRGAGNYSMTDYQRWLEPRLESGWRKEAARIIAMLPNLIVSLLFILYLLAFRRNSRGTLYEVLRGPVFGTRLLRYKSMLNQIGGDR